MAALHEGFFSTAALPPMLERDTDFPPEEELDDLRAFREVILAGHQRLFDSRPQGARRSFQQCSSGRWNDVIELLPGKSLDSRPDGSPWRIDMERVVTPASLEDLGDFSIGATVEEFSAQLRDTQYETLPYHVSVATRSIITVQHEEGFSPTLAPFMFVGQRQHVKRVFALPWDIAAETVETLPEAKDLGPVLVIQMTGRCGSTVLSKAMEWLEVGCQSISEPEVLPDIHEMLERGLCTRAEAVKVLRSVILMMVHQRRRAQPDKPIVVIKNRSLSCCWRHCELLTEAVPGVKQIFQWRNLEDVIGSFHVAVEGNTVSPCTRALQKIGKDRLAWFCNGSPVVPCMQRMLKTMLHDPALHSKSLALGEEEMSLGEFVRHGSLGYQTLRCILCAHAATVLGQQGHWQYTLSYEDLMKRKSACVAELLDALGWRHFIQKPEILGTAEGDKVFLRDAHSGGGLSKAGGSTVGGDAAHLESSGGELTGARVNAHLPHWQAEIVRHLLSQHRPLKQRDYDLSLATQVPTVSVAVAGVGGA